MSFNCGLSHAKISVSAWVTVSEEWKASVSAQNFTIAPKGVPVKHILASVEDGLRGIFRSETDLNGGKGVSTVRKKKRSRSVLTKKRTHDVATITERSKYYKHQGWQR